MIKIASNLYVPKSFQSVNSISNYLFSLHYLDCVMSTNLYVLVVCRDRNKLSSTRTVTYFLYQASDQLKFYRKNYLSSSPNCSADVSFPFPPSLSSGRAIPLVLRHFDCKLPHSMF